MLIIESTKYLKTVWYNDKILVGYYDEVNKLFIPRLGGKGRRDLLIEKSKHDNVFKYNPFNQNWNMGQ